ncbi:putative O-linked N-acetylglucosamine transferase (SPINDLY family) [Azospirillum fermentarium]|uniref:O-linked N-acetylglucosamine transferase, SPINDLY family protein n=1 Tax=Azospirillum fermentarium TaxID=1233114 RepID=UPI002226B71C|nr:tetratricopeptide repeat protein [Azospirillum fermentarium]MCW2249537.1 putative O-linked N-acetylglucosamine transferase (SPINDLY family) [Azospirillum fermentarium]
MESTFEQAVRHHQAGRLAEAEKLYWTVLKLRPNHARALQYLGVIARQTGHLGAAISLLRQAVEAAPKAVDGRLSLGNALSDAGYLDEAAAVYGEALAQKPDFPEAHFALGNVLMRQGHYEQAQLSYLSALSLRADYADAWINLGNAHRGRRHFAEAAAAYRRVIALNPAFVQVYANLGSVLREVFDLDGARRSCLRALTLQPASAQAWNNLGIVEGERGDAPAAAAAFRQALADKPDFAEACGNLGNLSQTDGQLAAAVRSYEQAVAMDPAYAEVYGNLGVVHQRQDRLKQALTAYRRSLCLRPDNAAVHSNLIFAMDFDPGCGVAVHQAERRFWNERHAWPLSMLVAPHDNDHTIDRRLRIGYVSADFRRHSAAYAFAPILLNHDRSRFDVLCYSQGGTEDAMTARLRGAATVWRSIRGQSDEAVARQIRADAVDILVDLSGHSAGNRLLVFARKPAPVQVSAWGHVTGTGLSAMDYLLAGPSLIQPSERELFSETVVDLPCLFVYQPPDDLPPVAPPPLLMRRGTITFGCLNRLAKVSAEVLSLWAELLKAVPGARLLLKDTVLDDPHQQQRILTALREVGIGPERVVLMGGSSHRDHLAAYGQVDIALDPFPQNGGISTAEALWMGVPVITLRGGSLPGRVSASLLEAVGCGAWVADTRDDYLRLPLAILSNLPEMVRTRAELRGRMASSPLGNVRAYTAMVERVYRAMWRCWCEGQ